jgi:hypothetical protein
MTSQEARTDNTPTYDILQWKRRIAGKDFKEDELEDEFLRRVTKTLNEAISTLSGRLVSIQCGQEFTQCMAVVERTKRRSPMEQHQKQSNIPPPPSKNLGMGC